ncbi:MAG TPA: hypothetical protein VF911_19015 [Thermoanaerobaculia bacterium]
MKQTIFMLSVALIAACTNPAPHTATQTPATEQSTAQSAAPPQPAPAIALSQRCTNPEYGISLAYPEGWHTNDGSVLPACSAFDRAPVEIPRDSEVPAAIAVVLDVEKMSAAELTRSSAWERVLSTAPVTVAGRNAFRVEIEATGEGLADRGTRTLRYVVDLGAGRTLIASTHRTGDSYEQNQEILGRMMESVTFSANPR